MKKKKTAGFVGIALSIAICTGIVSGCSSPNQKGTPAGGASGTAANTAQSAEKLTLRLSDSHATGYITVEMDQKMADEISSKTNGRVQLKIYPAGQLGTEKAVLEQMQYGAIDSCRVSASAVTDFNKDIGAVSLPYIWTSADQMFRALDGSVGEEFNNSLLKNSKFVNLAWTDAGARSFYSTKKQIKTPSDLKGMKIRVQQSQQMIDLVKCFGASPTPMGESDIYSALQSGVIDGAENNWSTFISDNHYEICKYFTVDEHTRVPEMILFSATTWNKISSSDQQIIRAAAKDAADWERKQWVVDEAKAEKKAESAGTAATEISDLSAWREVVKPLYSAHPEWDSYVKAIQAVQ